MDFIGTKSAKKKTGAIETFNTTIYAKVTTKTSYKALRKQGENGKYKKIALLILPNVLCVCWNNGVAIEKKQGFEI